MDLVRIPVTNPGAIPNSGSIQFTAQIATVAKINFNRIVNDEEYNAFTKFQSRYIFKIPGGQFYH